MIRKIKLWWQRRKERRDKLSRINRLRSYIEVELDRLIPQGDIPDGEGDVWAHRLSNYWLDRFDNKHLEVYHLDYLIRQIANRYKGGCYVVKVEARPWGGAYFEITVTRSR